jgi:hypothetical protein
MINVYKFLVGKPEGRRPLETHRCRYKDYILMDLQEIGLGGENLIHLVWVGTGGRLL